ncbi:MAG TPA: hypothetical protein VMT35_17720 [Ignavibacteriaceae bacterium]|nr:hypothetical protein [Ignavibacteriaceae bacterium]
MQRENKRKNNQPKENKRTLNWFYIILVLIPFLFLVLLEGALRIFNYGDDYPVFVNLSAQYPERINIDIKIISSALNFNFIDIDSIFKSSS